MLINVVGGPDLKMREIQEAASLIQEQAHEDANIIFGASIDEAMDDAIKVTVIATGFDRHAVPITVETSRGAERPRESLAPQTRPAVRHAERSEPAPAYSTRRPAVSTRAAGDAGLPPVRDRITFPSHLDTDWDTPAFQRRQSSS